MRPWFPPGGRQTFFQKVKFTGDYLPRFGDDGLGMTDAELDVVFALPFLTVQTPLLITPFYAVHFLDGPVTPDVPPRLHDAAITFQNIRPINDRWLAMFDITVGQYADDESFDSSEAFRVTGGGAGVYRSSDQLEMGARRDLRRPDQHEDLADCRLHLHAERRLRIQPRVSRAENLPAAALVRGARQRRTLGLRRRRIRRRQVGGPARRTARPIGSTSPTGGSFSASNDASSAASHGTSKSVTSSSASWSIRKSATRST